MKKYSVLFFAFVFFVVSFFVLSAIQNVSFAATKFTNGSSCFTNGGASACGPASNNLICVPDHKQCSFGLSCGTGVCTLKSAPAGGSCDPNAPTCDASKGYKCIKDVNNPSTCGSATGPTCHYSCQIGKVATGGKCTGPGQGDCALNTDTCASIANAKICGIAGVCTICTAKTVGTGKQCRGSGQGNCASSSDACTPISDAKICGTAGVCTICTAKKVPTGKRCQGSGQGNCASSSDVCTPTADVTICGTIGTCNICKTQGANGNTCQGSGQGTCKDGLVCQKDPNCTGITCQNTCQPPLVPPTQLPPPPSPPCKQWGANGVCQSFGSTFGGFSTDPNGFIEKIFAILLSVSGGIALLLIIKAGYQLMTAQGKPEQLQNARDQLTAAIVGLVFLIFSFIFLELIGFDILKIPGFGSGSPSINNTAICSAGSCIPTTLCTSRNPGHCNSTGCPGGQSCVQ